MVVYYSSKGTHGSDSVGFKSCRGTCWTTFRRHPLEPDSVVSGDSRPSVSSTHSRHRGYQVPWFRISKGLVDSFVVSSASVLWSRTRDTLDFPDPSRTGSTFSCRSDGGHVFSTGSSTWTHSSVVVTTTFCHFGVGRGSSSGTSSFVAGSRPDLPFFSSSSSSSSLYTDGTSSLSRPTSTPGATSLFRPGRGTDTGSTSATSAVGRPWGSGAPV